MFHIELCTLGLKPRPQVKTRKINFSVLPEGPDVERTRSCQLSAPVCARVRQREFVRESVGECVSECVRECVRVCVRECARVCERKCVRVCETVYNPLRGSIADE